MKKNVTNSGKLLPNKWERIIIGENRESMTNYGPQSIMQVADVI